MLGFCAEAAVAQAQTHFMFCFCYSNNFFSKFSKIEGKNILKNKNKIKITIGRINNGAH